MKKQKIFKALGVGALCLCGALTFVGCSNVKISQEDADNAIATIQKYDANHQELIDILQQQNDMLKNQLAIDKAWGMYNKALIRLELNLDNDFDNMRVKEVDSDGDFCEYLYYKNSSGKHVYLGKPGEIKPEFEDNEYFAIYEKGTSKYVHFFAEPSDEDYGYYKKIKDKNEEQENNFAMVLLSGDHEYEGFYQAKYEKEDLVSVEILENGNYKLEFIREETGSYSTTTIKTSTIVISSEGKLLSDTYTYAVPKCDFGVEAPRTNTRTYEDGTVVESEVSTIISIIDAYPET